MKTHKRFSLGLFCFTILMAVVSMNAAAQSSNDQCSGVIPLTLGGSCTVGSIVSANTTTGDPTTKPSCWTYGNDDGVWYKFDATETGVTIDVTDNGATYTPDVAVYDGGVSPGSCPGTGGTIISGGCLNYGTNEKTLSMGGLIVGHTYYVLVDMPSTIAQTFCISAFNEPVATTATSGCPVTTNSPVHAITCADVGTPTFENAGGAVTYTNAGSSAPTPTPTCGSGFTGGSWAMYDLDAGVTTVQINYNGGGSAALGSHSVYAAFYQGSCGSLTQVSCQKALHFSSGSLYLDALDAVTGLDPSQPLYVYMFDDAAKGFTLPMDIVGTSSTPSNDACGGAAAGTSSGCNLAANGDAWGSPADKINGPMNEGASCSGGTWYSNENTVWYTAVASATTATIDIENTICNGGTTGYAQFGVFTSCACPLLNSYGTNSCFKGCAGGTGTISLSGLTAGTTYYIAVDGNAGDVCKWDFVATGLVLPIALVDFHAQKNGDKISLLWTTSSERNSNYFEIERSIDGENFQVIGTVKASGNEKGSSYSFSDETPYAGRNYYRLKEIDMDAQYQWSNIIEVTVPPREFSVLSISPVPVNNNLNIRFNTPQEQKIFIHVYSVLGSSVINQELDAKSGINTLDMDLSKLRSGMYFIDIRPANGKNFSTKIIKL